MEDNKIGLDDMIQALRRDLEAAQEKAKGAKFSLVVDSVELELSVAISKTGSGNAGIKFWVINFGGEYEHANESTHKFRLTLKPGSSGPLEVSTGLEQQLSNK